MGAEAGAREERCLLVCSLLVMLSLLSQIALYQLLRGGTTHTNNQKHPAQSQPQVNLI